MIVEWMVVVVTLLFLALLAWWLTRPGDSGPVA